MRWTEVGDGVLARRHEHLDLTLGLVIGTERCLVIDTGGDETQGAEYAAAVRGITSLPWVVVITHAHFDHHFGTRAFLPCPVWAHERCAAAMNDDRPEWVETFRREGKPELARRLAAARPVPPTDVLTAEVTLDLGGRAVTLLHPGRAHTDHDVAVHVPGAGVVFTGDLVEAEPAIGPDSHVREWPAALDRLLDLGAHTYVPGHGDPVGAEFVRAQRDRLSRS
ncbi:MBL fold metallo-hydrolase [Amycolatopsis sp. K13G38]|uniref:MBL fold metallo-hydrolase n=1 Tax=Amycolatopsis acididurans TaxID=2724524 RepID=A0ABX1JEG7_9PSEU|nr:MBL fold metallo-hydrolase [Amycolatopsis acididurans]NKQ56785.1 MBL fold metallo-hydrolase [Amycolatopsis acididurans]